MTTRSTLSGEGILWTSTEIELSLTIEGPMGVPTDVWKRLKEEDKKSLIEATRGYEATKSAPATSSALNLQIEEYGDHMEPH